MFGLRVSIVTNVLPLLVPRMGQTGPEEYGLAEGAEIGVPGAESFSLLDAEEQYLRPRLIEFCFDARATGGVCRHLDAIARPMLGCYLIARNIPECARLRSKNHYCAPTCCRRDLLVNLGTAGNNSRDYGIALGYIVPHLLILGEYAAYEFDTGV